MVISPEMLKIYVAFCKYLASRNLVDLDDLVLSA